MPLPGQLIILVKGGGEVGTAVAHRLARCHFRVCITEVAQPLAVTRQAAFCEAIYEGEKEVEGVVARRVISGDEVYRAWKEAKVPILVDPETSIREPLQPQVLVDAIMAKRNLGTTPADAPLVIGLGPGFRAGRDAHVVIETNNSNNLGRVIMEGQAEANTGIPIPVGGYTFHRVLHAPRDGQFFSDKAIGSFVAPGEAIGTVEAEPVKAEISGLLRGLIRSGIYVQEGTKLGEIDPLARPEDCARIRPLPRAIAGGVLEAILRHFNNPEEVSRRGQGDGRIKPLRGVRYTRRIE